ncbi:regulator of g protein signaling [Anaeramoeba flamelloides]|uniref:Regulator of g protein signaling n=1 Tax=Anaeramoeba flamelloides TaxID=1746091 RepID=A0AAV7Y640_9EUKA|nr:regulator of g protein signaling [Anaeramoeba flamelloides]
MKSNSGNLESTTFGEHTDSRIQSENKNGLECIINEDYEEALKSIESRFYTKRLKITGKVIFLAILIHCVVMTVISAILMSKDAVIEDNSGGCTSEPSFTRTMIIMVCLHLAALGFFIWKIRKIKDPYKIKKERFFQVIVVLIFTISSGINGVAFDISMIYLVCFLIYCDMCITYGYPLYLCRVESQMKKNLSEEKKKGYTTEHFQNILNNSEKLKYFVQFCQSDYSLENIMFYQSVMKFKKISSKNKRKKYSKNLFSTFIQNDSHLEINIESHTRQKIIDLFEKDLIDSNLFDEAKNEVFYLMLSNSYPTFLFSTFYKTLIHETNQLEITTTNHIDIELDPVRMSQTEDCLSRSSQRI